MRFNNIAFYVTWRQTRWKYITKDNYDVKEKGRN